MYEKVVTGKYQFLTGILLTIFKAEYLRLAKEYMYQFLIGNLLTY